MHADTDPATPDDASSDRGGWRSVARVTFTHHLRSPWFLLLAALGLVDPLLFLLARTVRGDEIGSGFPAADLAPFLSNLLLGALPILLLLLVVPAFRGAWLRDPEAARERVGGFFAGTLGAVAAALVPWAVPLFTLTAWHDAFARGASVALFHVVGALLLAAAWIAVSLLVAVAIPREPTRWLVAGAAYVGATMHVPAVSNYSAIFWGFRVAPGSSGWALLLDLLDPGRLVSLFTITGGSMAGDMTGVRYAEALGPLHNPFTYLVALLLWIAVPLLLAMRFQARSDPAAAPLEPMA